MDLLKYTTYDLKYTTYDLVAEMIVMTFWETGHYSSDRSIQKSIYWGLDYMGSDIGLGIISAMQKIRAIIPIHT